MEALQATAHARGWWSADGVGGAATEELVIGGFRHARVERHPRPMLFANQVGGFQVRCSGCKQPLVRSFSAAVTRHRAGGGHEVTCPSCGQEAPIWSLDFRPPARFARVAVHLMDVGEARLHPAADLSPWLGPFEVVARRVGP